MTAVVPHAGSRGRQPWKVDLTELTDANAVFALETKTEVTASSLGTLTGNLEASPATTPSVTCVK